MALFVFFGIVSVLATFIFLKLKSMRGCDIAYQVKTGLSKKMRPKATLITAKNGYETIVPNDLVSLSIEPVRTLKLRSDDVFICTYPKAGTTWMQEITWLICNNANTDKAKRTSVLVRSPFLESIDVGKESKGIISVETWPSNDRRIIKTHLPYELLPEELLKDGNGCKIIYVARNPKDLCVSYYFFHQMNYVLPDSGSWSEFLTAFCSEKVASGCWFKHTLKFWEEYKKDKGRIHFTTYEALKGDLRSELVKISQFLGKDLTGEQLDKITSHCTFDSMKTNKSTNYYDMQQFGFDFNKSKFMRKGQVGDWKNHFTINENAAFNAMYEEKMKKTDLRISFEL